MTFAALRMVIMLSSVQKLYVLKAFVQTTSNSLQLVSHFDQSSRLPMLRSKGQAKGTLMVIKMYDFELRLPAYMRTCGIILLTSTKLADNIADRDINESDCSAFRRQPCLGLSRIHETQPFSPSAQSLYLEWPARSCLADCNIWASEVTGQPYLPPP